MQKIQIENNFSDSHSFIIRHIVFASNSSATSWSITNTRLNMNWQLSLVFLHLLQFVFLKDSSKNGIIIPYQDVVKMIREKKDVFNPRVPGCLDFGANLPQDAAKDASEIPQCHRIVENVTKMIKGENVEVDIPMILLPHCIFTQPGKDLVRHCCRSINFYQINQNVNKAMVTGREEEYAKQIVQEFIKNHKEERNFTTKSLGWVKLNDFVQVLLEKLHLPSYFNSKKYLKNITWELFEIEEKLYLFFKGCRTSNEVEKHFTPELPSDKYWDISLESSRVEMISEFSDAATSDPIPFNDMFAKMKQFAHYNMSILRRRNCPMNPNQQFTMDNFLDKIFIKVGNFPDMKIAHKRVFEIMIDYKKAKDSSFSADSWEAHKEMLSLITDQIQLDALIAEMKTEFSSSSPFFFKFFKIEETEFNRILHTSRIPKFPIEISNLSDDPFKKSWESLLENDKILFPLFHPTDNPVEDAGKIKKYFNEISERSSLKSDLNKAKNIEEYLTIYINNLLDLNKIKIQLKIETIASNYDVVPELDEETEKEIQAAYEEHRAIKGEVGSGIIIFLSSP